MILNAVCVELGVKPNSMDGLQDRTSLKVFKMYRNLWIYIKIYLICCSPVIVNEESREDLFDE
jgi:hypothetical protein